MRVSQGSSNTRMVEMGDPWIKLATYTNPYQTA